MMVLMMRRGEVLRVVDQIRSGQVLEVIDIFPETDPKDGPENGLSEPRLIDVITENRSAVSRLFSSTGNAGNDAI